MSFARHLHSHWGLEHIFQSRPNIWTTRRPEEVARELVYSPRGLKETATDSAHLRRLISLQVDVVLAALQR
jgi:hypothetical protein